MGSFKVAVKKPPPFTVSNWLLTNRSLEMISYFNKEFIAFGVEQKKSWKKQIKQKTLFRLFHWAQLSTYQLNLTEKKSSTVLRKQSSLYQSQKEEGAGRAEGRFGNQLLMWSFWDHWEICWKEFWLYISFKSICIDSHKWLCYRTNILKNPLFRSLSLILSRTEGKSLQRLWKLIWTKVAKWGNGQLFSKNALYERRRKKSLA